MKINLLIKSYEARRNNDFIYRAVDELRSHGVESARVAKSFHELDLHVEDFEFTPAVEIVRNLASALGVSILVEDGRPIEMIRAEFGEEILEVVDEIEEDESESATHAVRCYAVGVEPGKIIFEGTEAECKSVIANDVNDPGEYIIDEIAQPERTPEEPAPDSPAEEAPSYNDESIKNYYVAQPEQQQAQRATVAAQTAPLLCANEHGVELRYCDIVIDGTPPPHAPARTTTHSSGFTSQANCLGSFG